MKAEDLRVGNYINYEQTTHELVSLNKDYCSSIWLRDKNKIKLLTNHSYKSIKPIPLTEQWLIDFGYEYSEGREIESSGFEEWYKDGVFLGNYNNEHYIIEMFDQYGINTPIKHVHQLQNIHYFSTNKELTK
jgi:hypothetical protein